MRSFRAALLVAFGAWAFAFFWLGAGSEPFWKGYNLRGHQGDYYNLLVEGFLKGQVSLNAEVDPGLLSPVPAVRARAPYLLDASIYRGRYFLYYGVTPAVALLLPYTVLTHQEMGLDSACLAFVLLGFGVSILWLDRLREWLRAEWGWGFAGAAVSVLAIVPATAFLVRRCSFYDLPIAAGYAFMACFWFALFNIWRMRQPRLWIIAASFFCGLSVGCRPNLGFTGLLLVLLVIIRFRGDARGLRRALVLAVLPAGIVGCCLGWYNWARFGSPFDFGFAHGINSLILFQGSNPLVSPRFIPANAQWYLLTPPSFAPRFPFDFPIAGRNPPAGYSNTEAMNGFLPVTFLMAWVLAACVFVRRRRHAPGNPSAASMAGFLLAAGILEAVFTFSWGIRAYRYAPDFFTPLAFLAVLGLAAFWAERGWRASAARAVSICLVAVAGVHALLGSVQLFDGFRYARPVEYAWLSSVLSPSQRTMERLGEDAPGPLSMTVRFSRPKTGVEATILSTGLPSAFDSLHAGVYPNGYILLQVYHGGYGGPRTGLIPVEWNRPYPITLSMGSLYPDEGDPYFKGWKPEAVQRVKTLGWLSFNGRSVIESQMTFYPGTPGPRLPGEPRWNPDSGSAGYPVTVDSMKVETPWPKEILSVEKIYPSLYKLSFVLVAARKSTQMPLLSSGITGKGNLLFFDPLPSGRYRLCVDQWGAGLLNGPEFGSTDDNPVNLEMVMGPALAKDPVARRLLGDSEVEALKGRLLVWIDGALVGDFNLTHHLDNFGPLVVGKNDAGFSSAAADFNSEIRNTPLSEAESRALLGKALAVIGRAGASR